MTGLANKKIVKRSGLVSSQPAAAPVSGRDMSVAAARMPSFDFAVTSPQPSASTPPESAPAASAAPPSPAASLAPPLLPPGEVVRIKLDLLVDSPYQPRLGYDEGKLAELAESLRHRQIDPLVVRPLSGGKFEIISGHRRKRAAPLAQLDELDCRIIEVSDTEARVLVLAANEPREDFTDFERALAYQGILDDGKSRKGEIRSQRQLAAKVGVDVALVNRRLSMLDLPMPCQEVLRQYPGAFSSRWVKKLQELTSVAYDSERLKAALVRVATGELQMTAVFSVMASAAEAPAKEAPKQGLSLHRSNRLFAQVTPNPEKRLVTVKLPGECDVQDVAKLILAALDKRFAGEPSDK